MSKRILSALYLLLLFVTVVFLNIGSLNSYFIKDDFAIIGGCHHKGLLFFVRLFFTDWVKEFFPGLKSLWVGKGFIRPLMVLSFKLDYLLYGTNPLGYHVTNILFHLLNAGLVFFIIDFIASSKGFAFLAAMVFAVHPAHSSGIAWISGRGEPMAAFFYLLSFYFFIRYDSNKSRTNYIGSLLCFVLGLFTKETVVMLPFLLVGYRLLQGFRSEDRGRYILVKRVALTLMPFFIILALYFVLRKLALGSFLGGYPGRYHLDLTARMVNTLSAIRFVFLASPFDFDLQSASRLPRLTKGEAFIGVFLCMFLLLPLLYKRLNHHWRLFRFGLLFAGVSYIPAFLNSMQFPYVAPLHLYLTTIGIGCVLIASIFSLYGRRMGLIISAFLIAFYASYQYKYNSDWNQAGSITKQIKETVEASAHAFQKGDTIILIDIPLTYKTAYVYFGGLNNALRNPFTSSDIFDDFKIKLFYSAEIEGILSNQRHNGDSLGWNEAKRILARTPMVSPALLDQTTEVATYPAHQDSDRIHLFKWNRKIHRLEEVSGMKTIL